MTRAFQPAYIHAYETGELKKRADTALARLQSCTLCPRKCGVDRTAKKELGICRTGKNAWVASYHPHFGEEAPLVGSNGSGTIFFTHCNLLCNFCQNFDISHQGRGMEVTAEQLAAMMINLQEEGCHNINFVTPSHVVPQILEALYMAAAAGLSIPLVYNSGGYDRVSTLGLLSGVFDIFMPDFKFWKDDIAEATCRAPDYPETARRALKEMHHQVGDLVIGPGGIAQRGLLVRHLVLPHGLAGTREIMRFIYRKISPGSYVNIMPQYRPCGLADQLPALAQPLSGRDFKEALKTAEEEGITRLDQRRPSFVIG